MIKKNTHLVEVFGQDFMDELAANYEDKEIQFTQDSEISTQNDNCQYIWIVSSGSVIESDHDRKEDNECRK